MDVENIELGSDREILISIHGTVAGMLQMCEEHKRKIEGHETRLSKIENNSQTYWKLATGVLAVANVILVGVSLWR
jgi:hypothetical protein